MKYRADVDGLRAVAIIPVVLFHAGLSVFRGGFVGVDIFFVISGYLITSIIASEIRQGTFSIVTFYERRIRRIFPALFALLSVCFCVAYFLFMPREFIEFSKSLIGTTLFVSNILFWRWAGYFDRPAEMKPLLHTWSLSVEEQFYIFLPIFLIAVYRWHRKYLIHWVVAASILSFVGSVWTVHQSQETAFYWAPLRAWELLLGSLLALNAFPVLKSRIARESASGIGLLLIVWSIITFSQETLFPGVNALLPCVGATLIIYAGQHGSSLVGRLLSIRPIVFVGLISYSLYLWHWPLLVFARYWNIDDLTATQTTTIVTLSVVMAVLSWKFIEQPFRKSATLLPRIALFKSAAAVMALAIVVGLFGYISKGWPQRLDERSRYLASFTNPNTEQASNCRGNRTTWIAPSSACVYGAKVDATWALWGDSHTGAVAITLGEIAQKNGQSLKLFAYDACPPFRGIKYYHFGQDTKCLEYNDSIFKYLVEHPGIKNIIMMGRYSLYIEGSNSDFGPAEGPSNMTVTGPTQMQTDEVNRRALYRSQITNTVNQLVAAGKRVILVYPVPETGYDIPATLARLARRDIDPSHFTRPFDYYMARHRFIFDVFDHLQASDKIVRIYPHKRLCNDATCIVYADGKPLYFDDDHLNRAGSAYISHLFEPIFQTNPN